MTTFNRIQTALTDRIDLVTAALALVPSAGFLLAWHMQLDLAHFAAVAILPALVALMACETWMATHRPEMLRRLVAGLVGGMAATALFDAIRLPAAYLAKGAPDFVPMIGQFFLHETIGIAPTAKAVMLGYAFHYLLIGALVGGAYGLVAGRMHRSWAALAGVVVGLGFTLLPQFQLLAVASGFSLLTAGAVMMAAFAGAGLVLGTVVKRLDRPSYRVGQVTWLPAAQHSVK
jgi:hypothetical protein